MLNFFECVLVGFNLLINDVMICVCVVKLMMSVFGKVGGEFGEWFGCVL